MNNKKIKNIEQYSTNYSESRLWSKIKEVVKTAGKKIIYSVLILYYVLREPDTPMQYKSLIIGTLGYFILPIDLIPDIMSGIGYTDDAAALATCIETVKACITPKIEQMANDKLAEWF